MVGRRMLSCAAVWLIGAGVVQAAPPGGTPDKDVEADRQAIAQAVLPSLVRVEFTLQTDRGDDPQLRGWGARCASCGKYHGAETRGLVEQERPLEVGGLVLAPNRVLIGDLMLHPRFVKQIQVRQGDQVVSAKPAGFALGQKGMVLELAEPLKAGKPLAFDAQRKEPYYTVNYGRENGLWTVTVQPLSTSLAVREDGRTFLAGPSEALVVDGQGQAVAVCLNEELPIDGSWKGSPADWPMLSQADFAAALAKLEQHADQGLVRVNLGFRSPKQKAGVSRMSDDDEDGSSTQRDVPGVLVDGDRVLVLADLTPSTTARLERIKVYPAKGDAVDAKFVATLKDFGVLVAKLDKPLPGAVRFHDGPLTALQLRLLPAVDLAIQGEQRTAHYDHVRVVSYGLGKKRQLIPQVGGASEELFAFDLEGRLVGLPYTWRKKVGDESSRYSRETGFQPVTPLAAALADLAASTDPDNIPLSEEQENRIAWLGVELQAMDRDLARANNVSSETQDGQTGALITYVYPGSPAAKAGLKLGDILLRLHSPDEPKPIELRLRDYDPFSRRGFPWDRYDDLPEQYFDRIPQPWPSVENTLNKSLTNLGFGKPVSVDVFRGGKTERLDFKVEQSPPTYDAAARYEYKPLGLTVRNMTYEVRRYFQRKDDEPGLIISKIEPGSKASVGGLKPYEVITHVNDKPVLTVKDFEAAVAGQAELKLSVKRMTRGRLVNIKLGATSQSATSQPASAPAGRGAAVPAEADERPPN